MELLKGIYTRMYVRCPPHTRKSLAALAIEPVAYPRTKSNRQLPTTTIQQKKPQQQQLLLCIHELDLDNVVSFMLIFTICSSA